MMRTSRREFLVQAAGGLSSAAIAAGAEAPARASAGGDEAPFAGQVGITTSTIDAHVSSTEEAGKISLFDLPKLLRDGLDMRVVDLNTRTLGSLNPAHVERFRAALDAAGLRVVNLKLNQLDLDLGNRDADLRDRTMETYRQCVDAAAVLGARWVRPLPSVEPPAREHLIAGYRQLSEYARPKQIGLLVENFRWMESDPEAATRLIHEIDAGVAASPDIGNWQNNDIRYAGLKELFPLAVTCDFKARDLGPRGEHSDYDLERCFQIGWDCGFRGPWCIEHPNPDREKLLRELALLRDKLRRWMGEQA